MIRFIPRFLVLAALVLVMTPAAMAQDAAAATTKAKSDIVSSLDIFFSAITKGTESVANQVTETSGSLNTDLKKGISNVYAARKDAVSVDADPRYSQLLAAQAASAAAREIQSMTYLGIYVRQLLALPLGDGSTTYNYVDITRPIGGAMLEPEAQQFIVLMSKFCDPNARNGDMGKLKPITVASGINVGCGTLSVGRGLSDRSKFGEASPKELARIVNLPVNAADLFFRIDTYPTATENRFASLYDPAVVMAINLLVGAPPSRTDLAYVDSDTGRSKYLETQAQNARKTLAATIFTWLAADRKGIYGPTVGMLLANELDKVSGPTAGDQTVKDKTVLKRAKSSFSAAEFLDVMAYQRPTGPGYIDYVNKLSALDGSIAREEIKNNGLAIAVNYKRNRLMELLTALEATRP